MEISTKAEYNIRTIKLKLKLLGNQDGVEPERRVAAWKLFRQIMDDGWRAANWIATGQLINDQLIRRIYARRKIDPKDNVKTQEIEREFFDKTGFFETKRQATTERDIKEAFPILPPCITNPLNQVVVQSYNKEKKDLLWGNRSLRTYKKGMPVTVTQNSVDFETVDGENGKRIRVLWKISRKERFLFEIYFGQDRANNRLTVERIINGKNGYSAPQLQLKDRDLFLLLPVQEPADNFMLRQEICVGLDLGLAVPAYVALNEGLARRAIGSAEDFLKVRMQMQARKRRLQRNLASARGGKGRGKRLKALNSLEGKERDFARSYNHFVSRAVVDFSFQHKAGTIKMEMLEGYGEDEPDSFILRNWSYFELQQFVEYKAKRMGISVLKVDPYHTSQTCSKCGHYEPGQRKDQKTFKCAACGEEMNADFNAAINISRSDRIVTRKEECERFKRKEKIEEDVSLSAGPTAEG